MELVARFRLQRDLVHLKWRAVLKQLSCLEKAASSCFRTVCAPNASPLLYLTRFAVLLQSDLKVLIKYFQASDTWKFGRNFLFFPDLPQRLYVLSACVKSSSVSATVPLADMHGPALWARREQNLPRCQTGYTTLIKFWWEHSRN